MICDKWDLLYEIPFLYSPHRRPTIDDDDGFKGSLHYLTLVLSPIECVNYAVCVCRCVSFIFIIGKGAIYGNCNSCVERTANAGYVTHTFRIYSATAWNTYEDGYDDVAKDESLAR